MRLFFAAVIFWFATAIAVNAGPLMPIFGAIAAFAATPIGGIVVGLVLNVGISLLGQFFQQKQPKARDPGIKLTIQGGESQPLSFSAGYSAFAGELRYAGTWGEVNKTPNAYLTKVIRLGSLPVNGLNGFWANSERCTILTGETPTDWGYPVQEFRDDGTDYMWVKFYDGTQTTADDWLVSQFGSVTDREWQSTFIGVGVPYAIVTTRYNREMFTSEPKFLFEPGSINFYDLRKDSTNGGSGSHRWNNPTTWEPSDNPIVIMYNIIRGIYYGNEWVYGGRNIGTHRLPASNWIAAANACDIQVNKAGGGTENKYRAGLHISVDDEPLAMLEELRTACNARLVEIGGIFEVLVDIPGSSIYSFTDSDIIISRGQSYTSFPGLQATYNGIEAQYPNPSQAWQLKDAPPRYNPTWEADDGERRLATGVTLNAVPFPRQAQRIMKAMIDDERRFRVFSLTLPPTAWILTGTSIISWTSTRNGFVNKKFIVTRAEGEPGMLQVVTFREIDPADYDWSSDDELPFADGVLTIQRPPPQPMFGFAVFPYIGKDNLGRDRIPTIEAVYGSGMPDVQAVRIQVKLAGALDDDLYFEMDTPYGDPFYNILPGHWPNNTDFEARAKFIPFSGRKTTFSAWLPVTTPDVKLIAGVDFDPYEGLIGFDQLQSDIAGYLDFTGDNLREVIRQAQELNTQAADEVLGNRYTYRRELASVYDNLIASYTEAITVATGPGSAVVNRIETLEVELETTVAEAIDLLETQINIVDGKVIAQATAITALSAGSGGDVNTANLRMSVLTGPSGYSRIGFETRQGGAGSWRGAALYLDTPNNPALPTRLTGIADQFVLTDGSNFGQPFVFSAGVLRVQNALIANLNSGNIQAGSINADRLNVTTLSAISANMGTLTAGTISLGGGNVVIDGPNARILISD